MQKGVLSIDALNATYSDWDLAMQRGDYPLAWSIADAVLASRDPASRDDPTLPYHERWVWDGRTLRERCVLVRCYHGLGDTLQFVRFLPQLRALASHVTLEVQPALAGFLAKVAGADEVIPFDVTAPAPSDCDIEIMELCHALRAKPDPGPYLTAVPGGAGAGKIGVCWQAGAWDPDRSIALTLLKTILPANTVSLQRGAIGLPDPLGGDMDIASTARFIASLDHVICVDTMIAHLAGGLGRPVSLLLRHKADWRWGQSGRSAWYRSVRLYRQHAPSDWSVPIEALGAIFRPA